MAARSLLLPLLLHDANKSSLAGLIIAGVGGEGLAADQELEGRKGKINI